MQDQCLPGCHIIQSRYFHTAICERGGEVVSPKPSAVRHSHIKTRQGRGDTCMLGIPVRHDPSLEPKLGLEESVQGFAVLAAIGVVDAVV